MRTVILVGVLCIPSMVAFGNARAAAPVAVSKPVCAHYDETPASGRNNAATGTVVAASDATHPDTSVQTSPSLLRSGGGSSSDLRPHDAPRWQAFLPGMFR